MNLIFNIRENLKVITPSFLRGIARSAENLIARPLKFVIVGTGRCGTTYTSELLTSSGIPCGHEATFNYRGINSCLGHKGDATWLAVPYLSTFDGKVLHQTRHPMKVINSFLGIRFFSRDSENVYRKFAEEYFQFTGDEVLDAMRWYYEWNSRCEEYADFRYKIEDIEEIGNELLAAIDVRKASIRERFLSEIRQKRKSVNSRRKMEMSYTDLPESPEKNALCSISRKYGYDVEQ